MCGSRVHPSAPGRLGAAPPKADRTRASSAEPRVGDRRRVSAAERAPPRERRGGAEGGGPPAGAAKARTAAASPPMLWKLGEGLTGDAEASAEAQIFAFDEDAAGAGHAAPWWRPRPAGDGDDQGGPGWPAGLRLLDLFQL
ncbi:unnamed protein product [Prorocentrum cordatum]|uniref:Uncharacterized protein n=1 Tax=Prorocentrum cordatum TaxID=2364126 RepID=A0ABN9PXH5_9DINO|nr:unnamed protein product [Polarella glacialis]